MLKKWLAVWCLSVMLVCCWAGGVAAATYVHLFDCKECHRSGLNYAALGTGNLCMSCHGDPPTIPKQPVGGFAVGDASDAFGHGNGNGADYQTSHTWAVATDTVPAAGAQAPDSTLHREFYSRYGASTGKITCSRCHNPHGLTTNPQLLVKGAGSVEAMCQACHVPFAQQTTGNHGLLSHPLVTDYATVAAANPAKYRSSPANARRGAIQLVDGQVVCTSCHGMHFVDSSSDTDDGKAQLKPTYPGFTTGLAQGDGKLLRADGASRADKSVLCQSCHTYQAHGGGGETVGCLVCHSGHSYDPAAPNYFVLRKNAATATFGSVTGLDYNSPDVLDPLQKSTWWNDGLDSMAAGYCEKCHGDAAALPGSIHTSTSVCTDCHKHSAVDGGSFGHPGDGDCIACHAADHVVDSSQMNWVTVFDNTAGHSYELGSPPFTVDAYATCSMCHTTNLLTQHNSNCIICHFGASPPRESFTVWNQTCQQGSCHPSYHFSASDAHDTEWDNDNCTKCHNESGFDIPWTWDSNLDGYVATYSACGKCHTLKPDTTPPASHSNLQPGYVDTALITLWANDATAVQAIYYRIDGGSTQTYGSPFEVTQPAEGSQAHTLEYWARDTLGNVESANIRNFSVARDTTPPVTTSDAKTLYGADATIHLTATDDATSFPVAATYYKVGTGGTVQSGNTAVIPEPADGSADHTLYFWSVDHAGNAEAPPKSATFTIVANGLVQTDMPMDGWLYGYSDPYSDVDRILADPWMSYAIYVDGVLIDTVTKKFYISILSNGQLWPSMPQTWTTVWRCPSGIPVASGSQIRIVVNTGFSDRDLWTDVNDVPATYTLTLPEGTTQLESVDWIFTTSLNWASYDYDDDLEEEISWVGVLPAVGNIAYVTTMPDTTPPVTTSNAASGGVYLGATTFALSVNDPGGTGVESTLWQLDSTSGAWSQGTSVPVPAPAAGTTKSHTLYWYSRDYAGNQEAVKSVSFSVEALQTVTTSLTRSTGVTAYSDEDTNDTAWASYTIKLDGATIGTKPASAATTWPAPLRNLTGAGVIEIVVDAGFTDRPNWIPDSEVPATFTLALPAKAKRLEKVYWSGFADKSTGWDCEDTSCNVVYSYVTIPAGTFGNIQYSRTGTDTDTTAPVTTCSATEGVTYNGDQVFTLTPSDTGSGVESTWWQLDGSGVWNIGTSIPITAPVSGTASHTITWYSRDNATNQGATQSVTFNMQP